MSLTGQLYEEYQQEFIERCQQVEEGEISPLVAAVQFKEEMDYLSQLAEDRKTWLNENVDEITNEAEQYGKNGFRGFVFTKQYRETSSFKHIAAWNQAENQKKAIEAKAKLAWKMVQNGLPNVDAETGEEIPLPEIKVSSFIKAEKLR
ncbi:hypothetical protein ATE47_03980 [Chryseobacterium sp. IHB B 17019]|uniref:hypothetical protein n=1 Tax=Chryseobacterium sp. IHB B 17019 TaxID=1721091 RepID=UPI00071F5EA8|nr:hypothetical protein [Chryseobacterium sp. IHB B 17019]ALR29730.1 hypothetical protein ATE47_03980 [Chryseobacterium sp. IHB B 17019]